MKKTIFVALSAAALMLASCSSENEPAVVGADSPLRVSAAIEGVRSRAAGTDWDSSDAIGISTVSDGKTQYANMKYVTSGSDGNFTHEGGDASGIFFHDTQDVTFAAYYPFTGSENTAAGIISEVSTENQTNQKSFDFLFASGATASYKDHELRFTGDNAFRHCMTRLVIKLLTDADSGFSSADVFSGSYSISGIRHSGTFDTATGIAEATGGATADWVITAPATDESGVRIYSMILFPQSDAALTLKAVIDGENYECNFAPALAAGTSYTYTITMKKTGLTVTGSSITDWDNGGSLDGDATMPKPLGNKTVADAQVGDFLFSDGSLVGKDDELTLKQKAACVAIVFWTPAETDYTPGVRRSPACLTDDKIMAAEHPDCTHGLAVAVKKVTYDDTEYMNWQSSNAYEPVNDWQTNYFTHADKDKFVSIASDVGADDNINRIYGYQNTVVLRAYNAYCAANNKSDYIVLPVAAIDAFAENNPAPAGSTGWFLPSVKELHILSYKDGDVDNIFSTMENVPSSACDIINNSINAVEGDKLYLGFHWPSTESTDKLGRNAFYINFYFGRVASNSKNSNSSYSQYHVRAVCAF